MAEQFTIGLLWHTLGHGNLGIDALTRANITILEAAANAAGRNARFVLLGTPGVPDPALTNVVQGPEARLKPLLKARSPFFSAIRQCDLVVDIGEGDSWTDIYGARRFAFQAGTKMAAILGRRPLILAPQTIGPFDNPNRRRFSDFVMNRARAVFSRDSLSTSYLASRRLETATAEFIDVAFRLPFRKEARTEGVTRIGLNVSGLLYGQGYTGKNELGMSINYRGFTQRLIESLLARPAVEIHLVSHVSSADPSPDDDRPVAVSLIEKYPALKLAPDFASASAAKSFLSGLDFVVAGRMHACIGAFSAGVPVVPIAYSRKFNGLFNTLNYPHFVDGKAATDAEAVAIVLDGFDRREELTRDLERGRAIAECRLQAYQDRMTTIIAGLS
jgi:polysaccharide pyruvyl transferase WcaK-like protein